MGHIMAAQNEIKENLDVTYILATDPGQDYKGNVYEVHRATQQHEEEGHSVMLRVETQLGINLRDEDVNGF